MAKPRRPSSPGGGSSGDASRLNRPPTGRTGALRRSALRFGRNTLGIPPSRALSGGRLAPTGRTGRSRRSPGFHHRLLTPKSLEISEHPEWVIFPLSHRKNAALAQVTCRPVAGFGRVVRGE